MKKQCFSNRLFLALLLLTINANIYAQVENTGKLTEVDDSLYGRFNGFPKGVTPPQYKSGVPDLMEYLRTHIHYPQAHKKAREKGRVVVRFVVNKIGKVIHPVVVKSASPLFDAEALRVVRNMDNWTPGTNSKGKPISVIYHVPFTFSLDNASIIEPKIRHLDLTSLFGHPMNESYLSSHVGKPFGMSKKVVDDEPVEIFFYYDRGDDILKVGKQHGLYFCDVSSSRFTLFDGYVKIGIVCPKDLYEHGWTLISTKVRKDKVHITQVYTVPSLHAQVALVINRKNGVISYFKVSRQDELLALNK